VSADTKARLVFLRWHYALPGHRAFTKYAVRDPRIDLSSLEKLHDAPLPVDPVEQNRAWYRIYNTVENDHAVRQVHRDFLLLRDYTGLCAVFIAFYGAAGFYAIPSMKTAVFYRMMSKNSSQSLEDRKQACIDDLLKLREGFGIGVCPRFWRRAREAAMAAFDEKLGRATSVFSSGASHVLPRAALPHVTL